MSILDFFGKRDTIKYILNDLNDSLSGKSETALKKLDKLQISVDEGIRILDAAKNTFPPAKYEWQDISAQLIEICAKIPYVEYIEK